MIHVHDLEITNVTQEYWNQTSIDIDFELITGRFQLHVGQNEEGMFQPYEIFHLTNEFDCPYCDGDIGVCKGLSTYKNDFFRRLIEHPSIRLEWLYLPHDVQV